MPRWENEGGPLRVLVVDDSPDDADIVARELGRGGRQVLVERVCEANTMRAALLRESWDLVLSDWTMPSFSGDAALEVLKSQQVDVPFIILSGTVTDELAIQAMRSGARDWVLKGKLARLRPAIERELAEYGKRKRAEVALRRSEELLRQSQKMDAIGGLAAGVAHDFNNVLSVIIGHADLLLAETPATDVAHESVVEIRGAAARAAELTRQLLAFSRQQILQPRNTDISRIVTGMAKMLRRLIGEDIDLTIIAPANNGTVLVDPGQMEQVIMNLAVNARDAMPRGGTLTIEVDAIEVQKGDPEHAGVAPGPHVTILVSDTGVGMDAATRARIFEPFFTTKEPGTGTGLGLAMVFGIVKQSGGMISADSEPGRGTRFKIYLPRKMQGQGQSAGAPSHERRRPKRTMRGDETVLLVEDDAAVRSVMRTILEKNGYRVLHASNGREALLLAEKLPQPVDLVLTDVVMPYMSGPEFAAKLVATWPNLRVLYLSGYTDGAIVHHGVLEPGIAFLQKPVAPDVLLQKVEEMLTRSERTLA